MDRNGNLKLHWLLNGGSDPVHEQAGQPEEGAIGREIVGDVAHLFVVEVVNEVVVAQEDVVELDKKRGDEPGQEAADTVPLAHVVVNEAALDRSVNMVEAE